VTDFQPLQTFQYATLYIVATVRQRQISRSSEDGPTVGILITTSAQRVETGESVLEILDRLGGQGWLAAIDPQGLPGTTFPSRLLATVQQVDGVQAIRSWWQHSLRRQLT
jgi:hypothetical protein